MANQIHPTAIVEDGAQLGDDVSVGPYALVGPKVKLGNGVKVHSHVVIGGETTIGDKTEIFPFASIGLQPQDLKFGGEDTKLIIGANNTIREYVTMNPGTEGGGAVTRVGDNGLFMASSHVAHDCVIGDNVILANSVAIAGHCHLGDFAIFGGLSCIHQFGRVGAHCFVGGASALERDLIPFGVAIGNRAVLAGLNLIGLKRRGFTRDDMRALRKAHDEVFNSAEGTLQERAKAYAAQSDLNQHVQTMLDFILDDTSRAICTPHKVGMN